MRDAWKAANDMHSSTAAEHSDDRFDYASNLGRAGTYGDYRSHFWPPADGYALTCLNLAATTPDLGNGLLRGLAALKSSIEAEWQRAKDSGIAVERRLADPVPVAEAMRDIATYLPGDCRAVTLRADAVQGGYTEEILQELAELREDFTVVAGQISTWYGKDVTRLPTAFACRRDEAADALVTKALTYHEEAAARLARLHPDLRLDNRLSFGASELFFMAGEGNLHPKHVAYLLPEREGVKYSPFRKTYYFGNTHRALLEGISCPLSDQFLQFDGEFSLADVHARTIPTLGVLSHELCHFVRRPSTAYEELNAVDQWAAVVLQEVAADVFGIITVADVWAPRLGIDPASVVAYYLAECLRFVDRGLGFFPDSDGMFLQLSYFVQLGGLEAEHANGGFRLAGTCETMLAALRSLARVLADALLAGRAEPAVELYRAFGPATSAQLQPLVEELRRRPSTSVEYVQEHLYTAAGADPGTFPG
jgi:hypothetical protein